MPLRFWELAAGCLVATAHVARAPAARTDRRWEENGVIVLIAMTLFLPVSLALLANIAVVALTATSLAILSPGSLAWQVLTSRVASYLGMMSYSLYLWHWPVLVLSRYTIGSNGWSLPILIGLIFLLAHLSYHYVENPLRIRPWARTAGRTMLRGGAAAGILAGLMAIVAVPLGGRLYAGRRAPLAARNVASLSAAYRIAGTSYIWAGQQCLLATNADAGKAMPRDACTLGPFATAPRRVVVLGNSFAIAFVAGFDELVRHDHYAVTITGSFGAAPIKGMVTDPNWARSNAYYWNTLVPQLVSQLRPGDWVLLISDLSALAPRPILTKTEQDLQLYQQGLRRFSAELARSRVRLAVLDADPFIRESGCTPEMAMPQWFARRGGLCRFLSRAETIARRKPVDVMLRGLQREHRLVVIDALAVFCPGQTCTFIGKDNHILYRDEYSHPSVQAARDTAPLFRAAVTDSAISR